MWTHDFAFQTKQKHQTIIEELLRSKSELESLKLNLSQGESVQVSTEQASKSNLKLRLTKSKSILAIWDLIILTS